MNTTIPWPNPQHSLDVIYYFFTGQYLAITSGWAGVFYMVQELAIIGVLLSVVFLIAFIYFHLQAESLHHHMEKHRNHLQEEIIRSRADMEPNPNRARWERIVEHMASSNPNDWRSAILDADVMLDALLSERGFVGSDLGEKLQSAGRGPFASIESAWEAHRTRNRIAHGGADFTLTDREARIAVDAYRRVFEEFNYI